MSKEPKREWIYVHVGLPCWLRWKEPACNVGDQGSIPRSGRSFGEGNGYPLQYSGLENARDGGAWWAAVYGVTQIRTQLKRFSSSSSRFHFHALEKEMATHSSVLAWRMPGMVEPGGLPSMGSHRVRHDWSDLAAAAAAFSFFNWLICVWRSMIHLLQTSVKNIRLKKRKRI